MALRALKEGERIALGHDQQNHCDIGEVIIGPSLGFADLRVVSKDDGSSGLIAFKRDGSWWLVRELERPPNA